MTKTIQTEKDLASFIEDTFRIFGWKYYHTWQSIHSVAGFPDYVAVRGKKIIWAELKRDGAELSEKQREWIAALRGARQWVYIWYPSTPTEDIVEVLR